MNRARKLNFDILEDAFASIISSSISNFEHVFINFDQIFIDFSQIQISTRKRALQNITISTNNVFIAKKSRTRERKSIESIARSIDASTTNHDVVASSKNKSERSRKQSQFVSRALFYDSQSLVATTCSLRRFIRFAQRSQKDEEKKNEKHHILEALRDLKMNRQFFSIENIEHVEESRSRFDINDFVKIFQILKKSLDSKTIAIVITIVVEITRTRREIYERDERKLRRDWMIKKMFVRKQNLYVLFELQLKSNRCSHCKIYQYDEKCREKSYEEKYWHCCFNDKISSNL